ncbi:response regulator transcription factor [Halostreptopolyspora alba]|uniref:DNA-binding response regulator n=1 Tax=Halostreptopolyspora alba TaxID=2487137 RepID=A0A3N0E6U3_9ACTN|nr:DNA-binding response regulator [Nocardiopsaceae bacterium YIM 96095]
MTSRTSDFPIRVLAADDNVVVRAGLVALLDAADNVSVVAEAGNGAEAIELAREHSPDVVLLDIRMPIMDGVNAVGELVTLSKVVMLTHTEDPDVINTALQRGASGYLVHGHFTLAELSRALEEVVGGSGTPLSPVAASAVLESMRSAPQSATTPAHSDDLGLSERESDVMEAVAQGLSNDEIASTLFLSEKTVKNYLNRIFRKLQVSHRAAAIARWNGHASPHPPPPP